MNPPDSRGYYFFTTLYKKVLRLRKWRKLRHIREVLRPGTIFEVPVASEKLDFLS
jgi:hypothetical protein